MVKLGWVWQPTPEHKCTPPHGKMLEKQFESALWLCACGEYWEVVFAVDGTGGRGKTMRPISKEDATERMRDVLRFSRD